MTDKELDAAIWYCREDWQHKDGYESLYDEMDVIIKAARELQSLKNGTHPDMVIVPMEPTDEMSDAGIGYVTYPDAHIYCYKAMIAAAQKVGG